MAWNTTDMYFNVFTYQLKYSFVTLRLALTISYMYIMDSAILTPNPSYLSPIQSPLLISTSPFLTFMTFVLLYDPLSLTRAPV